MEKDKRPRHLSTDSSRSQKTVRTVTTSSHRAWLLQRQVSQDLAQRGSDRRVDAALVTAGHVSKATRQMGGGGAGGCIVRRSQSKHCGKGETAAEQRSSSCGTTQAFIRRASQHRESEACREHTGSQECLPLHTQAYMHNVTYLERFTPPYLGDPEDGVSVDVKVWRVGDAQQDLHTGDRNPVLYMGKESSWRDGVTRMASSIWLSSCFSRTSDSTPTPPTNLSSHRSF
ncbi:hypothetical protein EYF80_056630 [Liparis tanakae]|uniref:Uncharacterized protein n=1 Tax=Liparis tanakae TaxID=230148 RepID=A0A4Z2EW80_9TELE|nr:hypothetical protein EYF80_056630 [Liparis tanakae]